jgi:hypothetical protein
MPSLPQTTPPHSLPLSPPPHTLLVDNGTPILQETVEGMMRNLALKDIEAGDASFRDHNIATMWD